MEKTNNKTSSASVAQLVLQLFCTEKIIGSNPIVGIKNIGLRFESEHRSITH